MSENQVLNQIDDDDNDHEDSTSMETAPYSPIPVRQTITAAVHRGETPPVQSARRCQEPVARMLNQVLDTLFIYPHHHQTCQMEHQVRVLCYIVGSDHLISRGKFGVFLSVRVLFCFICNVFVDQFWDQNNFLIFFFLEKSGYYSNK